MSISQSTIKNEFKNVISLAIDIRKSTSFFQRTNSLKKATDIIAGFMEDVYVSLKKQSGLWDHFIFAGDGLIAIAYTDDNEKAFDKIFEQALTLRKIIIEYKNKWNQYDFNAGIGISYSEILIRSVDNIGTKFNNVIFVGESVSYSTKLCSCMPLFNEYYKPPRYIAMNDNYFKYLNDLNRKKCQKTSTKYVENI